MAVTPAPARRRTPPPDAESVVWKWQVAGLGHPVHNRFSCNGLRKSLSIGPPRNPGITGLL
jgi:hypothetical protein